MKMRIVVPLFALGLVGLTACEADQEALEEGVRLDAPEEIENAPLVDTVGPEQLGDGATGAPAGSLIVVDTASATGAPGQDQN